MIAQKVWPCQLVKKTIKKAFIGSVLVEFPELQAIYSEKAMVLLVVYVDFFMLYY